MDLCHIPVVVFTPRISCAPLRELFVLRNGRCRKGYTCIPGYTLSECIKNCIDRPLKKKQESTESESLEKWKVNPTEIVQEVGRTHIVTEEPSDDDAPKRTRRPRTKKSE